MIDFRLRWITASVIFCLAWTLAARSQLSYDTPKWKEEIANGYLPYRRLRAADFPVNDRVHREHGMYTRGFRHYNYKSAWKEQNGRFFARITEWSVRSGFDRNKSSRRSWFKFVEQTPSHEQGHLNISELHSRRLARTPLEKLPVGEGGTVEAAELDLKTKVQALVESVTRAAQAEQDAYDAATSHAANSAKQREWTSAINKRLREAGISH